ncbi:MAG: 1-acyl-sn-glycerol-3-phosphate acyltransferase [Candidatus Azotimanducaceae bacterium]|jgi:1-acyl-sn-glycerol-3-phosphate acyltransferase
MSGMQLISSLGRQLLSFLTALVVIFNLGTWVIPLFVLILLKLITAPFPQVQHVVNVWVEWVYRIAAAIDSLWMLKVVRIKINIHGQLPDHPAPIIVANHQTWFDIPVLQYAVTQHGPILKFLIKKELIWVPIVGWICWALNFPRLNRGTGDNARERDYAAIESASAILAAERGALLIFAEGTRFTQRKHDNQRSDYSKLLTPRPGGLKIALASVDADTPIVDLTINYNGGATNFWRCLHGSSPTIDVHLTSYPAGEIGDVRLWLEARWSDKDELLSGAAQLAASR